MAFLPIISMLLALENKLEVQMSEESKACIDCHASVSPGIVADWNSSFHAKSSPEIGLMKSALEKRISSTNIPENMKKYSVGCYECHSLNSANHKDNFEHFGYNINIVVSPKDCAVCHKTEEEEYSVSKKAQAIDNLKMNPVYTKLVNTYTQIQDFESGKLKSSFISTHAGNQSCFACHGTEVKVNGKITKETDMGSVEIPKLENWPNQGVGRKNPDGSLGACTSCHPRHSFSVEIARQPYTCGQCHLEPDVPAYNVYKESKHGNIYESMKSKMNFSNIPWTVGKDFTVPTCATCHNSLIVDTDGNKIAERSHDFASRLGSRLFGLIYSHNQPKSGATYSIINKDKMNMPVSFDNTPASDFLISMEEKKNRNDKMARVCLPCHSAQWTKAHFEAIDSTNILTNMTTKTATKMIQFSWEKKWQDPSNPFDESIEQLWVKHWLIYSNSIRYATAMAGPDYAGFKNGWFDLNNNLQNMKFFMDLKKK